MSTLSQIQANLLALGFSNTSAASVIQELAVAIAPVIDATVTEINNGETALLATISAQNSGHAGWYVDIAKAFQYGYSLSVDTVTNPITGAPNLNYYYATIDASAQIINQAAFTVGSGLLYLKVATLDSISGLLVPLSGPQLSAFAAYFGVYELPGIPVTIINTAANILNFTTTCTYYATYDLPTLQTNVSNALNAFRDTFAFDGTLYITDLETYMAQNVPGIKSFYTYNQTIDSAPFGNSTVLSSGYFNYFASILSQITYTPI